MIDKNQSQTIDLLRFPLAVFVVFIHTMPTLNLMPLNEIDFSILSGPGIYNFIEILIKRTMTHIAVPVFYVISGFLFFQKLEKWDWGIYKKKMQSRAKTLLIPYLIWIILAIFATTLIPAFMTFIESNSIYEAYNTINQNYYGLRGSFWDGKITYWIYPNWLGIMGEDTYPLIEPLWFLRDLMVVMVFSPIFHLFFCKTKYWGLILLGFCYISGIWPIIHGFNISAVFHYGVGCYLAINNLNIVNIARKLKYIVLPSAAITLCIYIFYCAEDTYIGIRVAPIYVLFGVWSAFYISSQLIIKYKVKPNRFLVSSCFFIYALHNAPYYGGNLLANVYYFIESSFIGIPHVELLQFLLPPIITILICLGLFWLLQRFAPRLCALLTGNRG